MIWLAVAYWLTINTIGVGVIIGSMCSCKQQREYLSVEKAIPKTEEDSHEEYSPDHFKNMVEENTVLKTRYIFIVTFRQIRLL